MSTAASPTLTHVTTTTGHVARVSAGDVWPKTLIWLRPLVEAARRARVLLPPSPGAWLEVDAGLLDAVTFTVGAAADPLVTCAVAICAAGADEAAAWLDFDPAPDGLPVLLVRIEPAALLDPAAAAWLGDAERCIGWALLLDGVP